MKHESFLQFLMDKHSQWYRGPKRKKKADFPIWLVAVGLEPRRWIHLGQQWGKIKQVEERLKIRKIAYQILREKI